MTDIKKALFGPEDYSTAEYILRCAKILFVEHGLISVHDFCGLANLGSRITLTASFVDCAYGWNETNSVFNIGIDWDPERRGFVFVNVPEPILLDGFLDGFEESIRQYCEQDIKVCQEVLENA